MLTRWIVNNFKPLRLIDPIELGRLTVLAGLNSAGKSSVIQSILLVGQTLANQNPDRALILNGHAVRLGTFRSVRNDRTDSEPVILGFELMLDDNDPRLMGSSFRPIAQRGDAPPTIAVRAAFSPSSENQSSAIEDVNVVLERAEVTIDLPPRSVIPRSDARLADTFGGIPSRVTAQIVVESWSDDAIQEFFNDVAEGGRFRLLRREPRFIASVSDPAGIIEPAQYPVAVTHFLPEMFVGKFDLGERRHEDAETAVGSLLSSGRPLSVPVVARMVPWMDARGRRITNAARRRPIDEGLKAKLIQLARDTGLPQRPRLRTVDDIVVWSQRGRLSRARREEALRRLSEVLVDWLSADDSDETAGLNGIEPVREPIAEIAEYVTRRVTNFFAERVRYVGPLRADPHTAHGFSPSSLADDVGSRGEYAAAVYDANKHQVITWWNPDTQDVATTSLEMAMGVWVRHLGVAHAVKTAEAGVAGVSWQVQSREASPTLRGLPAVGVGISQVLPILVAGLLAPSGALLLFEQPELHLHARAQARLGDFFLGLTKVGKQCIVETHSDCLVNQFRLHIVTNETKKGRDLKVYFVEQDDQGDARFEPIELSSSGNIVNWPDGFFDESYKQEDLITREAALARVRANSNE